MLQFYLQRIHNGTHQNFLQSKQHKKKEITVKRQRQSSSILAATKNV